MSLLLITCGILVFSGIPALFASHRRAGTLIAVLGVWIACLLALIPVVAVFTGRVIPPLQLPWSMPWGTLSLSLDALSAFFCLPIIILSPLAAVYGRAYLAREAERSAASWFFFNLLTASMLLLVLAQNGVLFLIVWEIMALSSYVLVVHDHDHAHVREAGWIYLIATHLGGAVLLLFFALLGNAAGSLDFDRFQDLALSPAMSTALFLLAVTGFGAKAGLMPLHVWLPEAHAAAPTHVSALLSGVMIKMGLYGLLRTLTFLGSPQASWGWILIFLGLSSGTVGVLYALAQRDVKKILAYSSVENIGIITLGLGMGVLGLVWEAPMLTLLGFAGGLLHLLNHTLFKGLLFFGAGAVIRSTGVRSIEQLGGLLKRMPWTGTAFLFGAFAAAGLPPCNGFISEFLIFASGFQGILSGVPLMVFQGAVSVSGLGLIGGLAFACFTRGAGIAFLGEPRSPQAASAREIDFSMRWPMALLAAGCLGIGLAAPWVVQVTFPAVRMLSGNMNSVLGEPKHLLERMLLGMVPVFGVLFALTGMLFLTHRLLMRNRVSSRGATWDCGYLRPTARMQYSGASFAQPIIELFRTYIGVRWSHTPLREFFPKTAVFTVHTRDLARDALFAPLFGCIDRCAAPIRRLQHGRVHLYVLYLAVVLIALLIWKMEFAR